MRAHPNLCWYSLFTETLKVYHISAWVLLIPLFLPLVLLLYKTIRQSPYTVDQKFWCFTSVIYGTNHVLAPPMLVEMLYTIKPCTPFTSLNHSICIKGSLFSEYLRSKKWKSLGNCCAHDLFWERRLFCSMVLSDNHLNNLSEPSHLFFQFPSASWIL